MDEDKENITSVLRPKYFTTLKEFRDLDLPRGTIYWHLQDYLLKPIELQFYRYPLSGVTQGAKLSPDGFILRKCYRCRQRFEVTPDGTYRDMEKCYYHPCRPSLSSCFSVHDCCGAPSGSTGCRIYPCHICGDSLNCDPYKFIREKRHVRVDQLRRVYAIDCEMVYTKVGLEVARVAIVDEKGLTVYESMVQPVHPVLDYCTEYSGITPRDLLRVNTKLADVQTVMDQLLHSDCILVGHGLDCDLRCLKLSHTKVIDTSVVFSRADGSKRKLKEIAFEKLGLIVQNGDNGHDCVEDARTCMALMLQKMREDRERRSSMPRVMNCLKGQNGQLIEVFN